MLYSGLQAIVKPDRRVIQAITSIKDNKSRIRAQINSNIQSQMYAESM